MKLTDLSELERNFGYDIETITHIIDQFWLFLENRFVKGLFDYNNLPHLLEDRFEEFSRAFISRYVEIYERKYDQRPPVIPPEISNTIMVIDGTDFPVKRYDLQKFVYNKKKDIVLCPFVL